MEDKVKTIEQDLLVQRIERVVYDPDRFETISIVLMVLGCMLFTMFMISWMVYKLISYINVD